MCSRCGGFEVRNATSLDTAMSVCASFLPAVLVSDVQMPNLDVAELCRRFREVRRGQRTAVLLISGRSEARICMTAWTRFDLRRSCPSWQAPTWW